MAVFFISCYYAAVTFLPLSEPPLDRPYKAVDSDPITILIWRLSYHWAYVTMCTEYILATEWCLLCPTYLPVKGYAPSMDDWMWPADPCDQGNIDWSQVTDVPGSAWLPSGGDINHCCCIMACDKSHSKKRIFPFESPATTWQPWLKSGVSST